MQNFIKVKYIELFDLLKPEKTIKDYDLFDHKKLPIYRYYYICNNEKIYFKRNLYLKIRNNFFYNISQSYSLESKISININLLNIIKFFFIKKIRSNQSCNLVINLDYITNFLFFFNTLTEILFLVEHKKNFTIYYNSDDKFFIEFLSIIKTYYNINSFNMNARNFKFIGKSIHTEKSITFRLDSNNYCQLFFKESSIKLIDNFLSLINVDRSCKKNIIIIDKNADKFITNIIKNLNKKFNFEIINLSDYSLLDLIEFIAQSKTIINYSYSKFPYCIFMPKNSTFIDLRSNLENSKHIELLLKYYQINYENFDININNATKTEGNLAECVNKYMTR